MQPLAAALAHAFLAGAWDPPAMVSRAHRVLGRKWRWLSSLTQRVHDHFAATRPRHAEVARYISRDRGFLRAMERHEPDIAEWLVKPPAMNPVAPAQAWDLPSLVTPSDLADWLGITHRQLCWFADLRRWEARLNTGPLRHYRYRILAKRFGQVRVIESPKPRLKTLQRQILEQILNRIPPHAAAHGFRIGGSIRSFAEPHVRQAVVIRIDLQDFFPSIFPGRVQALFRTVGFPERVADYLAGLCLNSVPGDVWDNEPKPGCSRIMPAIRSMYARPHLPQGAPTSPAIANLCAYRLDCRLRGLAWSAGAVYTRYADDLAFSGGDDFRRRSVRFRNHVLATVLEEGFHPHYRKSRSMSAGVRQHLAGIVVNRRLNLGRKEYERLKATLHNCVRHGVAGQNRKDCPDFRAHLAGRIAFVASLHPARARKLRALFDEIVWPASSDVSS